MTNRITKKYLDLDINNEEYKEGVFPHERKTRKHERDQIQDDIKPQDAPKSDLPTNNNGVGMENEHGKDEKEEKLHMNGHFGSKTKLQKVNDRKEVVRYVEIPSSFPHFPRITEIYEPNPPNLMAENKESFNKRLPIPNNKENQVRLKYIYKIKKEIIT